MDTKTFSRVEIKDAETGAFTAVISTFGVIDLDGDVTSKTSFTEGAPVVISAYGHTSWDGGLPVGKGVLSTTDTEALVDGHFFLNTSHGRDTFETVKHLSEAGLQEWSYSLESIVAKRGELDGKSARFIESTVVKEASPVLRGASVNTRTLAIKAGDLKFSEHRESVVTALDELLKRAAEVVTLRAEQGKSFAQQIEARDALRALLVKFDAVIDEHTPEDPADDEFAHEMARFVAFSQGVTLT